VTRQRKIEKALGDFFLKVHGLFVLKETYSPDKIDPGKVDSILVILRHQMGDMLCAVPMLYSLKEFYGGARLALVTKDSTNFEQIFSPGNSPVNEVSDFEYGFENFLNLIKDLRGKRFDIAVVPSTVVFSASNHLIAYYSRSRVRAGVSSINDRDNKADYLLNVKNDFLWETNKVHQIERNLDIIRQLNISPSVKQIRIQLEKKNSDYANQFFNEKFPDKSRIVVGIHPGAAKPGNMWNVKNYTELLSALYKEFNCYVFISVGPEDMRYAAELRNILSEKYDIQDSAYHRGSLMNNMGIINLTDLFITNDTGVMHLASGLDVPEIALFGPTKAYEWGPLGINKVSIQSLTSDINDIKVEEVRKICIKALAGKIAQKYQLFVKKLPLTIYNYFENRMLKVFVQNSVFLLSNLISQLT
jgi:heptosyltransferase-2